MKILSAVLLVVCFDAATSTHGEPVYQAQSAEIPSRPVYSASQTPDSPILHQSMRPRQQSANEELKATINLFKEAYKREESPRILILFNRSMEDSEEGDFVKLGKVEYGVSGKQENKEYQEQGEASVSVRKSPATDAYDESSIQSMEFAFIEPFVQAGAVIIDRDTAVRLHGIDEKSVFSIVDLPESQQAQVEAIRKHADIIIAVTARRGTSKISKVSGDYLVEVPILSAKAIDLRNAKVLATGATDDVKVDPDRDKTVVLVAGRLLGALAAIW